MGAIEATGAERVGVTHGNIDTLVRYLNEQGRVEAYAIPTRYKGEQLTEEVAEGAAGVGGEGGVVPLGGEDWASDKNVQGTDTGPGKNAQGTDTGPGKNPQGTDGGAAEAAPGLEGD
jgi:hypothetical protein